MAIKPFFVWFGAEANARAITSLLAIGSMVGALGYFFVDRIAPQISPHWSSTSFGEGYRRGQREIELEHKLQAAETSLNALRTRQQIDERVKNMTKEEVELALKKWNRD